MAMKQFINEQIESLDKPFEISDSWSFLKKGKLRIIIIYEDLSYKDYYVKNKKDYVVTVKKRNYMLIPNAVLRGQYSTLIYYYNNPMPIKLIFKNSKLSTIDLTDKKKLSKLKESDKENLADIFIDAKAMHTAMTSNLINKMYHESGFTAKHFIIIAIVLLVITLIILQVTGTVDVLGWISGAV